MRLNPVFDRCFRKLYGKPCWNTKSGYGSFITLEFGEPHLVVREPRNSATKSKKVRNLFARRLVTVRGDWHLWIYCCNWYVYSRRKLVGDSSSVKATQKAIRFLDGQALVGASFSFRGCRSVFEFDLGARLTTTPFDTESEQWMLYQPAGKVLSATGGQNVHTLDGRQPARYGGMASRVVELIPRKCPIYEGGRGRSVCQRQKANQWTPERGSYKLIRRAIGCASTVTE